jgi:2-polyprenyl-3-methyl-5-hydroxy-6-metoxy-1,4-benzoquinol methylase
MKGLLGSKGSIIFRDIDKYFEINKSYDIVLALGLLYHLKNPMGFLESLGEISKQIVLSTRVIRETPDKIPIGQSQLAYLVASDELNNDPTNYWLFTPEGLKLALKRTGWQLKNIIHKGCTDGSSNPRDAEKDERAFLFCVRN